MSPLRHRPPPAFRIADDFGDGPPEQRAISFQPLPARDAIIVGAPIADDVNSSPTGTAVVADLVASAPRRPLRRRPLEPTRQRRTTGTGSPAPPLPAGGADPGIEPFTPCPAWPDASDITAGVTAASWPANGEDPAALAFRFAASPALLAERPAAKRHLPPMPLPVACGLLAAAVLVTATLARGRDGTAPRSPRESTRPAPRITADPRPQGRRQSRRPSRARTSGQRPSHPHARVPSRAHAEHLRAARTAPQKRRRPHREPTAPASDRPPVARSAAVAALPATFARTSRAPRTTPSPSAEFGFEGGR